MQIHFLSTNFLIFAYYYVVKEVFKSQPPFCMQPNLPIMLKIIYESHATLWTFKFLSFKKEFYLALSKKKLNQKNMLASEFVPDLVNIITWVEASVTTRLPGIEPTTPGSPAWSQDNEAAVNLVFESLSYCQNW